MGPEGSLPCSQGPATGIYAYPTSFKVSSHSHTLFIKFVLILSFRLRLGIQSVFFLEVFKLKFRMRVPLHHHYRN